MNDFGEDFVMFGVLCCFLMFDVGLFVVICYKIFLVSMRVWKGIICVLFLVLFGVFLIGLFGIFSGFCWLMVMDV